MNKIYIVGDTHGTFPNISLVLAHNKLDNDMIIVAGDFGFVWQDRTLVDNIMRLTEIMKNYNSILAFVDGNHENFELLYQFPMDTYCGGIIHRLSENVIHLTRGQVFTFFGNTYFTMGGANSIDKVYRRNHVSWWKEEDITHEDIENGLANLARHNNEVDYVITHTCPQNVKVDLGYKLEFDSTNENILSMFRDNITFKHWYFGHMHEDKTVYDTKGAYKCLYYGYVTIPERTENDSN